MCKVIIDIDWTYLSCLTVVFVSNYPASKITLTCTIYSFNGLHFYLRDAKQIANQGDISLEAEDNLVEIRSNEHSSGGTSPCVLYLDIFPGFESDLGLYGLEVVSEARNIEVYGESDGYIGTSKGCLSREGK